MSIISETWFDEAKRLDFEQALFIRVANKSEQIQLANEFEEEREKFIQVDPVHASQIFISKVLKDRKQYIVITRKYRAPFTAFLKDEHGDFSKISVDPERKRMLRLMLKDKLSREEIEGYLNGLTEDEIAEFFPEK